MLVEKTRPESYAEPLSRLKNSVNDGKGDTMGLLGWAVLFLVIAIIAAVFGFGGIAAASAGIAKVLFVIFLVIFVILLIMSLTGKR